MALELSFAKGAALISGCGRIGSGVARLMAKAGIPVFFTYRNDAARALALEAEIRGHGGHAKALQMDLEDPASVKSALDISAANGGLRHVVSSGGPMMPFGPMAELDAAAIARFVNADAIGTLRLVQHAIPHLRPAGGSITLCTTIANSRVVAFDGASPFSKGALEALVRQVAAEEAAHKIRCNAVAISWVSDLTLAQQLEDVASYPEPELSRIHVLLEQLSTQTPAGRPAASEEAAWLFAFLASEQASYITGQSLKFDGGFSLGGFSLGGASPGGV